MIGNTSSGLLYQLTYMHSICMCISKIATYKRKFHNGKIEIISFVVKFRFFLLCPHYRFRCVGQGMNQMLGGNINLLI
jgi:hypothetical protein